MKVSVAHVANGQIAGTGDLVSLLGGDENTNFASLLDLGGNEPGAAGAEGSRDKQGNRSRQKQSEEKQPSASMDPKLATTSNPVGLQILPSYGAPWQLESDDRGAAGDAEEERSPQLAAEATGGKLSLHTRAAIDVQTVDAPVSSRQRVQDENAVGTTPFPDLSDPELTESSKGAAGKNQDATITRAIAAQNHQDMTSAVTRSPSGTSGVLQPSSGLVDSGVAAPIPHGEADSKSVGISVAQEYAAAVNHGVKSDGGRQDPAISKGEQSSGLPAASGGGQVRSTVPRHDIVDTSSSSTTGGRGQGNGTDTHRSPFDPKEVTADGHLPPPQTSPSSAAGALASGSSVHGQSALMNSNHPESIRETTVNAELKETTPPRTEDASAGLLGGAMRGDLRVGVHTEAFGRVTIQTNAQGGQLSAQLSLENPKESATLAAHLPGVEQKIVQQHGLNASVRLVGGFDGGPGGGSMGRDQSGAGRREAERYHSDVVMRPDGIGHDSSNEGRGVETALLGSKYLVSSRLDVTV